MQGVERSFKAASKSEVFEKVRGGPKESGCRAGNSTPGEPSPTPIGSDIGYPHSLKGYLSVQKERGTNRGANRGLPGRAAF